MSHYIGPHYNGTRFRQVDFPNMNGTFPVRLVRHGANTRLKTNICGIPSPWVRKLVVRKLRGTIVNIILQPRVLFHCGEIYFTAETFILLPLVLFSCREIYFTAASFILAPRVLFYCREFYYTAARFILPPRVLFSPPRVLFSPLAVK